MVAFGVVRSGCYAMTLIQSIALGVGALIVLAPMRDNMTDAAWTLIGLILAGLCAFAVAVLS